MFGGIGNALGSAASYLGGLLGFSPEAANQAAPNPAPVGPQAPLPNSGLLSGLTAEQQRLLEQFRAMQGLSKAQSDMSGQRAPMPGLLPTPDIFAHRRAGRM